MIPRFGCSAPQLTMIASEMTSFIYDMYRERLNRFQQQRLNPRELEKFAQAIHNVNGIDSAIFNKSDSVVTRILLYGNESFKDEVNLLILNATIDFVLSTNRFDEPLYLL